MGDFFKRRVDQKSVDIYKALNSLKSDTTQIKDALSGKKSQNEFFEVIELKGQTDEIIKPIGKDVAVLAGTDDSSVTWYVFNKTLYCTLSDTKTATFLLLDA